MNKKSSENEQGRKAVSKNVATVCVKMYGYEIIFPVVIDDYPALFQTFGMIVKSNGEDLKFLLENIEKVLKLYTDVQWR